MPLTLLSDSIQDAGPLFTPRSCVADDAPQALTEAAGSHIGVVEYTEGIEPEPRPLLPGYNDGVTALVTGIFVLLAISVNRHTNFLKTITSSLLSGRRAGNTFDDHTVEESRVIASLLIVCCVCEGILLYFGAILCGYSGPSFTAILAGIAVAVLLMGGQTAGYLLTGFAFSLRQGDTRQWVRGFFASQALLGLTLTMPALLLIFYPGAAEEAVAIAAALYVVARVMFMGKGFRFFYTNFFSLIYFILYLCTLEIAPILFLWRMGIEISGFV